VNPAPEDWIAITGYCFKAHTIAPMNAPTPHNSANLFGRFITNGRTEIYKGTTITTLCFPASECIAKKVKALVLVLTLSHIILTVNYLRLLRMKFQPTL